MIIIDFSTNPLTYNGNTFTWRGKELVGYAKSDGTHFEYCYDTQGLRTQKKAYNSSNELQYTVNYVWNNGKITAQDIKINNQTISCKFVYQDGNEAPSAVMTDTETYLLQKNLQEDVVAIIRASDGETMVSYTYDPWGKILTANYNSTLTDSDKLILKLICPFRYRGYCYDSDISLYYLQSRYYNPNWKRFVNVDDTSILLSTVGETHNANLFAYCSNNPVNRVDYSGRKAKNNDGVIPYDLINTLCIMVALCSFYDGNVEPNANNKRTDKYFKTEPDEYSLYTVSINLLNEQLYSTILGCMMIDEDLTWQILAILVDQLVFDFSGREILFSDDCIAREIEIHFKIFMGVDPKRQHFMSDTASAGAIDSIVSTYIYPHVKKIDIYEKDVYDWKQCFLFHYATGIRERYLNTYADPYDYQIVLPSSTSKRPIESWSTALNL